MTRRIYWIVVAGMVIIAGLAIIRSFSGGNEVAGQHLAWAELAFTFPGMWDLGGLIGSVLWVGTDPRYSVRYWGMGMTIVSVLVAGTANGFQAYSQSIDVLHEQGWPVPAFVASFVVPIMYATLTHIAARSRVALADERERLKLEAEKEDTPEITREEGDNLLGEAITEARRADAEYAAHASLPTVSGGSYPRQTIQWGPPVRAEEPPFGQYAVVPVQLNGTSAQSSSADGDLDREATPVQEAVQEPVQEIADDVPDAEPAPVPEPVQPEEPVGTDPSFDPRMAPPRGPWEVEDDAPTVMLPITRSTAGPVPQPQANPQPDMQPPAAELPMDDDMIIERIVAMARASEPVKLPSVNTIKQEFDIGGTSKASRLQHKAKAELGL